MFVLLAMLGIALGQGGGGGGGGWGGGGGGGGGLEDNDAGNNMGVFRDE